MVMCRDATRSTLDGMSSMSVTVDHTCPASLRSTVAMSMDRWTVMDDDGESMRCAMSLMMIKVWDLPPTEAALHSPHFANQCHSCSPSSRQDGYGDDDDASDAACPPSSPGRARPRRNSMISSAFAFAFECHLFALQVGD